MLAVSSRYGSCCAQQRGHTGPDCCFEEIASRTQPITEAEARRHVVHCVVSLSSWFLTARVWDALICHVQLARASAVDPGGSPARQFQEEAIAHWFRGSNSISRDGTGGRSTSFGSRALLYWTEIGMQPVNWLVWPVSNLECEFFKLWTDTCISKTLATFWMYMYFPARKIWGFEQQPLSFSPEQFWSLNRSCFMLLQSISERLRWSWWPEAFASEFSQRCSQCRYSFGCWGGNQTLPVLSYKLEHKATWNSREIWRHWRERYI